MIIDVIEKFYTDEEREQLSENYKKTVEIIKGLGNDSDAAMRDSKLSAIARENFHIYHAAEQRYIDTIDGDIGQILGDSIEIVNALEKKDFEDYQDNEEKMLQGFDSENSSKEEKKNHKKRKKECAKNWENCCNYITMCLNIQLLAVDCYYPDPNEPDHEEEIPEDNTKIRENIWKEIQGIIQKRADEFYPRPQTPPEILSIIPKYHIMPNNALMNKMQQIPLITADGKSEAFDMVVANAKGKRKEILAYAMIEFDPGETGITITGAKLTEYERQVSDAIVSLWIEAAKEKLEPILTPDMIFRAMPGGGEKASPQQNGSIKKTIEKFRRLHITIDATEEMRTRGVINSDATFELDNFYLSATHAKYKVKNGGRTVDAYKIDAEPIILTYCNMTKQLLTVPAKYIAIEKVKKGKASGEILPVNAGRQAMIGYMLRRIAIMNRDKKNKVQTQSNTILFDTLFRETGTVTTDRKQTGLNRNFCFDVLEFWKAAGYIKDFHRQTKGRSITGIEICL